MSDQPILPILDFDPTTRRLDDFEFPRPGALALALFKIRSALLAAEGKILIVDLSHWNGIINFAALVTSGVKAVIIKCSESTNYKDPRFEENWQKALDVGLVVMVYHFYRDGDPLAEKSWFMTCAENFLNAVDGKTAFWLDVESDNGTITNTMRGNRVFAICDLVVLEGLKAGVYSSPYFVNLLFNDPANDDRWNDVEQWNAHWTAGAEILPAGWSAAKRKVHQFGIYPTHSWTPVIVGAGTVDCNWGFWATQEELKIWLGQVTTPLPPPQEQEMIMTSYDPANVIFTASVNGTNTFTVVPPISASGFKDIALSAQSDKPVNDVRVYINRTLPGGGSDPFLFDRFTLDGAVFHPVKDNLRLYPGQSIRFDFLDSRVGDIFTIKQHGTDFAPTSAS